MKTKNSGTRRCANCGERFGIHNFLDKYCPKPDCQQVRNSQPKKSIKKVSTKRNIQNEQYTITRQEYLAQHTHCERCNALATEIHHKNDRFGDRLNDVTYFMASCNPCHIWIHLHPEEAKKEGWLI